MKTVLTRAGARFDDDGLVAAYLSFMEPDPVVSPKRSAAAQKGKLKSPAKNGSAAKGSKTKATAKGQKSATAAITKAGRSKRALRRCESEKCGSKAGVPLFYAWCSEFRMSQNFVWFGWDFGDYPGGG
jgi:hypothetical protein